MAEIFRQAVNWEGIGCPPPSPEKKTETLVNQAREEGVRRVFPGISEDIDWLTRRVARLRSKPPKNLGPLRKGIVETLADLAWLAWTQNQKPELAEGAREILASSLFIRITKGRLREQGFCKSVYQGNLMFVIRGLRDLPPGSLSLIGEFLEHQLEANRLMEQITQAEQLRVAAAGKTGKKEEFNDSKYRQVLSLIERQIEIYEEAVNSEGWRRWPSRQIAAVAHAYLMAATIEQSRAKHTLETDEEKNAALDRAVSYYQKLNTLTEELNQRNHLYTADGSGFIWPVAITSNLTFIEKKRESLNSE